MLVGKHSQECLLVNDADTKLICFGPLGTGVLAGDDIAGFFRHAGRNLPAGRTDPVLGLVARHRAQRSGNDERLAAKSAAG